MPNRIFTKKALRAAFWAAIIVVGIGAPLLTIIFNLREVATTDAKLAVGQAALQNQINRLEAELATTTQLSEQNALSSQQLADQQSTLASNVATVAKESTSQNDLLTAAVAKAAPSVVSIVAAQYTSQLSVSYENPFGDDPNYENFGVKIPVYHTDGTTLQEISAGTGFIINANGYILTNKHVVADTTASYTVLLSDGTQKDATVIYRDPTEDMAVVKIAGSGYPTLALGDSSTLKLAQAVIAIGNALGEYSDSVSTGIVSGLNRTVDASSADGLTTEHLTGIIQTDAAINPGNSGGPLLNLAGQAVGINVATVEGSNDISFSIPIDTIITILRQQNLLE